MASLPSELVAERMGARKGQAWASYWLKRVKDGIDDLGDFERPLTSLGYMGRGTKWLVQQGCQCPYSYGGVVVPGTSFPEWMKELLSELMPLCGFKEHEWPNACNVNLYVGGDGLSWHADAAR